MHVVETLPRPVHQDAIELRLARRDDVAPSSSSRSWLTPGFSASTAFINLAPRLVCVFTVDDGPALTHQQIGELTPSMNQLWNGAADRLAKRALVDTGVEFLVRNPAAALEQTGLPPGLEVGGHGVPPTAWLAHPKTFTVMHRHFQTVLDPHHELVYATRDDQELFIFDAPLHHVRDILGRGALMTYSVGFPLMHDPPVSG
ncbi:hypothetical protein CYJ45_05665 [Corynebacterium coyleae]|nr:hypothetical protein CYJ45_05665 [Corynebacterium coyleae]